MKIEKIDNYTLETADANKVITPGDGETFAKQVFLPEKAKLWYEIEENNTDAIILDFITWHFTNRNVRIYLSDKDIVLLLKDYPTYMQIFDKLKDYILPIKHGQIIYLEEIYLQDEALFKKYYSFQKELK